MTCQWSVLKVVRINHFNLCILILISGQYQTLAAETQQQTLISLGDALQVSWDQFDDLALLSFNRVISFIHCEYSVEEVNDIRSDVYIFIGFKVLCIPQIWYQELWQSCCFVYSYSFFPCSLLFSPKNFCGFRSKTLVFLLTKTILC